MPITAVRHRVSRRWFPQPTSAAWAPTSEATVEGWWPRDNSSSPSYWTIVSGRLDQWADASGKGRHLIANTAANRPYVSSTTVYGEEAIEYRRNAGNTTCSELRATGLTGIGGNAWTFISVFNPSSANTGAPDTPSYDRVMTYNGGASFNDFDDGRAICAILRHATGTGFGVYYNGAERAFPNIPDDQDCAFIAIRDGDSLFFITYDSSQVKSVSSTTTGLGTTAFAFTEMWNGNSRHIGDAGDKFAGSISEMMMFSSAMTEAKVDADIAPFLFR